MTQSADIAPSEPLRERIVALERAVAADPGSDMFVDLARVLLDARQYKRATLVLRAALRNRGNHLEGTLLLGRALLARGKRKSATRELARLLSQHPSSVPAMKLLSRALIESFKLDEALIILQRARQTSPADAEILDLLDRVHGLRRGRERDDIVIKERDGGLTGIKSKPRRPAFTGYIQQVADGPTDDPSVLIDASYKQELTDNDLEETVGLDTGSLRGNLDDTANLSELDPSLSPDVTFQEGLGEVAQNHPYANGPVTSSVDAEDEDDRTRPMSSPPEGMQWAAEALRPPVRPARPSGPTQSLPKLADRRPLSPPPMRMPARPQRSDPGPTQAIPKVADGPGAPADLDGDEPTEISPEGGAGKGLNPTMQLPAVVARALELPPTHSVRATPDTQGSHDDWLGNDPTEALTQGGADGAPHLDEEDPDIISSARPINRKPPASRPGVSSVRLGRGSSRPAPPMQARASLDPVDLLSIPLSPDEFSDMPPKPAPVAAHALPPDLVDSRSQPAVKVQPAAPRGPVPPKRPAANQGVRGPIPPKRPARGPVPPKRPSARVPTPPPVSSAQPSPPPATPAPKTPAPNYEGSPFASYFDARGAQGSEQTDHLAAMVGAHLDPSPPPRRTAAMATTAAPPAEAPTRRRASLRLGVAVGALSLPPAGLAWWRYEAAVGTYEVRLETAAVALEQGGFAARIDVAERLSAAEPPGDALASVADTVVGLLGSDGLDGYARREQALLARVQAERVARYGQRDLLAEAEGLAAKVRALDPTLESARMADGYLQWAKGAPDAGLEALLVDGNADTANVAELAAHLHQAAGRLDRAQDFARKAVQLDERHADARTLLADLKAARGENSAALQDYAEILDTLDPDHVDARIARERLRIRVNKRPRDAMKALKALLETSGQRLAPAQVARVHDAVGLYHVQNDDLAAARAAYRAALEAAPEDPRFSTGLARLDLREFRIDAAETVLRRAAEAEPGAATYRTLLAEAALLKGDPEGALRELSRITGADAEALLSKGIALLDLGKPREAEAVFAEAARADAGLRDARLYRQLAVFLQGRQSEAVLAELRTARSQSTTAGQRLLDRALPFRAYAQALAHANKLKAAAAAFRLAVDEDPRDFRSHVGRCNVAARQLRTERALTHGRTALSVNPQFRPAAQRTAEIGEAWLDHAAVVAALKPLGPRLPRAEVRRLARAHVALGEWPEAERLATHPALAADDASQGYVRGVALAAQGKLIEAETRLAPVTEQLSDDPWAQLAYGELLLTLGSAPKATAFFRRAAAKMNSPRPLLGQARAALRTNDLVAAQREAKAAERLAARSLAHPRLRAEAIALQGLAALQSGRRRRQSEAARLFTKALRLQPDLPTALLGEGMLREARGQLGEAVDRYYRVIKAAPRMAEAHYRQGRLLFNSTNPESRSRGRADLERAKRLDPQGQWGARAGKLLGP